MPFKQVNVFDQNTGEFSQSVTAFESPQEPGVYHCPEYSTDKPLPVLAAKQVAVFCFTPALTAEYNGTLDEWAVQPDFRGEMWFDAQGSQVEVIDLGTPPLILTEAMPTAMALQQAKTYQANKMSGACSLAIIAGFASSALGAEHNYPCNPTDQINTANAAFAGGALWCADSAGNWAFAAHAQAQASQVHMDMIAFIQKQQANNADKQTSIVSAASISDVEAIVW